MLKQTKNTTTQTTRLAIAALSATALVSLAGCGTTMIPPAELATTANIHTATDRTSMSGLMIDESFVLGAYKVADVDRDWLQHESSKTETFDGIHSTAGYVYTITGGPTDVQGTCAWASANGGVSIMGVSVSEAQNVLTCECTAEGESSLMKLSAGKKLDYAGDLEVDGESFKVTPVKETEGMYLKKTPPGYRIDGADGVMGAVEVIRPGRLWLSKELSDEAKGTVSCAMTGLMLMDGIIVHKM